MKAQFQRFLREESGATAIEYGLIVSLVGITLVVVLQDLGLALAGMYEQINHALDTVAAKMR